MTDSEHPDPQRLWRNRRRMAWLSLASIIAILAGSFIPGLDPNPEIVRAGIGALCLVVVAYIANCAVEAYINRNGSGQ